MKCISLISAIIALGFATTAIADTVSYTTNISNVSSLDPSLEQFNSTLGLLTGASVTLDASMTPIVSVLNLGSSPVPFTSATVSSANGATFVITDPYDGSNTVSTDYSYTVTNGTANPGFNDFADPSAYSLNTLTSTVPGADLASYEGSGTYALGYSSTDTMSYSGSPGYPLFYGGNMSLGGTATVTYTFTPLGSPAPTPLPKSLGAGLVLMGLLGASVKFRRKAC